MYCRNYDFFSIVKVFILELNNRNYNLSDNNKTFVPHPLSSLPWTQLHSSLYQSCTTPMNIVGDKCPCKTSFLEFTSHSIENNFLHISLNETLSKK